MSTNTKRNEQMPGKESPTTPVSDGGITGKLTKWTIVVPALTVAVFAGIAMLSLVEIDKRRPAPRLTQEEISAEVLARYERESEAFSVIRAESRNAQTTAHFVEVFTKAKIDEASGEPALPSSAVLLADVRAYAEREAGGASAIARALVPLWRERLAVEGTTNRELDLLRDVVLGCAAAWDSETALPEKERRDMRELATVVAKRQPAALGTVLFLLRQVSSESDLASLCELRSLVETHPQHQHELEKLIASLGGKKAGHGRDA